MMENQRRSRNGNQQQPKRRIPTQRTFEAEIQKNSENALLYFIKQELGYYNALVEQMTPRLRAFPHEFMAVKDRERKLFEACAEHAVDPRKLLAHSQEEYPANLKHLYSLFREQDGSAKIDANQATMLLPAASPARLHPSVRKLMATEVLKYMVGQSEVLHAGLKTEGLRAPMQMLNTHTIDTKRHLQIPGNLIKIRYDTDTGNSEISIPYSKEPISVVGYDLSEIPFKLMVIRSPHPNNRDGKWYVDFKDSAGYLLTLTDHADRRRR